MREVHAEVVDVVDRGPPPAVDGLARVADRGHGMPATVLAGTAAEETLQHPALGDRGVLVLVQQHGLEPGPLAEADLGALDRKPGAGGHLVGELSDLLVGLQGTVGKHQLEQLVALTRRRHSLVDLDQRLAALAERLLLQGLSQCSVVLTQLLHADQVVLQLRVEGQDRRDHRGQVAAEPLDRVRRTGDHPGGELETGGVGDDPQARLKAEPQPVLGQQAAGVRVVRGDGRLRELLVEASRTGRAGRAGRGREPVQRPPNPRVELAGCLVGEGQPEKLAGADPAGADQPHHARGHHRGLAGPGTGDYHARLERCGDDPHLLVAHVDPEHVAQLIGIAQHRARPGHRW
jgi:hypothetical protein